MPSDLITGATELTIGMISQISEEPLTRVYTPSTDVFRDSAPEGILYALDEYVKNGGNLIATFRSCFADEHIKIYHDTQPHILHEALGIHYDQFTYPQDVSVSFNGKCSTAT